MDSTMIFSTFKFEKVYKNQRLSSIKDIIFSIFEQMEENWIVESQRALFFW
jgi:hypothetical protein